jgi:hypothetical protein
MEPTAATTTANTASIGRTRTGTYEDMPFPVTLVNVPITVPPLTKIVATQQATPLKINAIEHLPDQFASVDEGKLIYPLVKQALDQGRKVILSVKGLELDGSFFDEAFCHCYGAFTAAYVDSHIEVVDIEPVDVISLDDMVEIRKIYYYNRPLYDKIMSNVDPELRGDDDEDSFLLDDEITCTADMKDFNEEEEEDF